MGLVTEGHYVVGRPPGSQPVLLLGPYASHQGAASNVARARRGHRRARPSAYGWQYGTTSAPAQPGRPLPEGSLNRALGLWPLAAPEDIAEEPELETEPEPVHGMERRTDRNGVALTPYVRARFRHARLTDPAGEPLVCEVTRLNLDAVWFRPIRADGSRGECIRAAWGREFESAVLEWVSHPTMRQAPA
jgi:hypothetical protein